MNWIKHNNVVVFLFLAFAFSWWPWPSTFVNPKSAAMIPWGPMFAAFMVLGLTQGQAGVKSLIRDMFRFRVGSRWYALAVLLPIGITLAAVFLNVALGPQPPSSSVFSELYLFVPALVMTTIFAGPFTEEPGWRGFLLPRLQAKYSPMLSSLIIGIIWWSWHIPVMVSDPTGQRPPLPYLFSLLAFSILFSWIYNQTSSSVFIIILMHGVTNTTASFLFQSQFGDYYARLWWLYAGLWWVAAMFVLFRGSTRAKFPEPVFIERGQDSAI